MVFSSLVFLCIFLPAALLAYYLTPRRFRNGTALAVSLLFYAWGAPRFVFVLVGTSVVDYWVGLGLAPSTSHSSRRRHLLLALAITINLLFFFYFKYMNFFVEQVNAVLGLAGESPLRWTHVALPIGISFFTFQKLSYLVDVYRGTAPCARSFPRYLLYVSLFPQLIAGPIVRYHDVARQLVSREYSAEGFLSGAWRFAIGLAKKVLIANVVGEAADSAFGAAPGALTTLGAWVGALCYTFQIYFDFSGYSDMAIGLGRMLGLHFLENFNFPYVSAGFVEFWKRWHISLSNWMREYLYFPLGGNRVGPVRAHLNLWIVFLLSGIWHGASWNFVVWGFYHGCFISMDKFLGHVDRRPPRAMAIPVTFFLVLIGWVFFRAETLTDAVHYLKTMSGAVAPVPDASVTPASLLPVNTVVAMALGVVIGFSPLMRIEALFRDWDIPGCSPRAHVYATLRFAATVALIAFCVMALTVGRFNPFIYFRF